MDADVTDKFIGRHRCRWIAERKAVETFE